MRAQGWGLMKFSIAPCWSVVDKFRVDQAYSSAGGRWNSKVVTYQFGGGTVAVSMSVMAAEAQQVLDRGVQLLKLLVVKEKSLDREREFVALLNLGGLSADDYKTAFRSKLIEIIQLDESAEPLRKILGRTQDRRQLEEWYL